MNRNQPKERNGKKLKNQKIRIAIARSGRYAIASVSKSLFEAYSNTEDNLTRCAISYLLKNRCKVSEKEEDLKKFAQRRRKVEIQIERLTEQLAARIPKGRDLTDTKWLDLLDWYCNCSSSSLISGIQTA